MQLAPDSLSRIASARAGVRSRRVARPRIFYPVGSRSEAVRLAPVVQALGELDLTQVVVDGAKVFDADGVPRTERLVAADPRSSVERLARSMDAAEHHLLVAE